MKAICIVLSRTLLPDEGENMAPQNEWQEDLIFTAVSKVEYLTQYYPDHPGKSNECNWFVAVIEGDKESLKLAETAAEEGWVVGKFATQDSGYYAVAIYIPDAVLGSLAKKSGIRIEDWFVGSVRVCELGRNGAVTPMLGTWNWENTGASEKPRTAYPSAYESLRRVMGMTDEGIAAVAHDVEARLLHDTRLERLWKLTKAVGQQPGYDIESFVFNVRCVAYDAAQGRITMPKDHATWVEALNREYMANALSAGL
jgi:hypothetical protein